MAIVLCGAMSTMATVTMNFTWSGTLYQAGFTADLNSPNYNGQVVNTDDAIGIYAFDIDEPSSPYVQSPFYSVCLSPAGLLDENTHTYTVQSFTTAGNGLYPDQWVQPFGINNAAWLWSQYGTSVRQSGDNASAAALEFAIWTALYNSTGYGALGNSYFTIQNMTGTTLTDYNNFITDLTSSGITGPQYTGNILEGQDAVQDGAGSGQSQEFFLLGTPVPEPTTMIAGALLLLPFGMSTLRMLRKSRTA